MQRASLTPLRKKELLEIFARIDADLSAASRMLEVTILGGASLLALGKRLAWSNRN